MNSFLNHPFVRELMSLQLEVSNFAIAGSGPLFVRGWIDDPKDIDVVARGSAWETAVQIGQAVLAVHSNVRHISLFGGDVDILDGWLPERWSVNHLIDEADFICGLRFVRLDIVVASKRMLARPRDLLHLDIIAEHTQRRPSSREYRGK